MMELEVKYLGYDIRKVEGNYFCYDFIKKRILFFAFMKEGKRVLEKDVDLISDNVTKMGISYFLKRSTKQFEFNKPIKVYEINK